MPKSRSPLSFGTFPAALSSSTSRPPRKRAGKSKTASQRGKSLNDKILSGQYDYSQLQSYLAEAQSYLETAIKKINDLKIPEKAKAAYEKTKSYLESLSRNYQQLKQLFSDLEALKQKGAELTAAAKAEIDKQITNLKNTVSEVGSQLNRYAQSLQKLGADLMAQYNKGQTQQ